MEGMADVSGDVDVVQVAEMNRFEARMPDGSVAGFLEYRLEGQGLFQKVLVMPHTVVNPQYEGRGVGSALVREALSWARKIGAQVDPQCSFVAAYLRRHPVYSDVWDGAGSASE
jgi:hypothetical protein